MIRRLTAFLAALWAAAFLLGAGTLEETPQTLKVATWNIQHGGGYLNGQRDLLLQTDADICILQEVDENTGRVSGVSSMEVLGGTEYPAQYFASAFRYDGGRHGIGILSKEKLYRFSSRNLFGDGYAKGIWKRGGLTVSVYNVHLDYSDDGLRAKQLEKLAEDFFADENPCRIIAGDFNIRSLSELDLFSEMGKVSSKENYFSTYHGLDWDIQAIDNIIYTPDTLRLVSAEMTATDFSDHSMLSAVFEPIS